MLGLRRRKRNMSRLRVPPLCASTAHALHRTCSTCRRFHRGLLLTQAVYEQRTPNIGLRQKGVHRQDLEAQPHVFFCLGYWGSVLTVRCKYVSFGKSDTIRRSTFLFSC